MKGMSAFWKDRAARFWMEVLPYFRYVANGGLLAFLMLAGITCAYLYARWIHGLQEAIRIDWIAVAVFTPVLSYSPIRTFLRPADVVYLLTFEGRMGPYFRNCFLYSFIIQAAGVFFVLLVFWPLYLHGQVKMTQPFAILLVCLLLVKLVNAAGSWWESQHPYRSLRMLHCLIRMVMTAVLIYFIIHSYLLVGVIFTLLLLLMYGSFMRSPQRLHWEHLIRLEQSARARVYIFINWFVDVSEQLSSRVRKRAYLTPFINLVSFRRENTYSYLYLLTFFRSELLGMVSRFSIFGSIGLWLFPDNLVKAILYVVTVYLTFIQLSVLESYHRHLVWRHIYPLPSSMRVKSLVGITYRLHLSVVLLLFIPFAATIGGNWSWLVLPLAAAVASYFACYRGLQNRWEKIEEEME